MARPLDVWASGPHMVDHLAPIWRALPAPMRGTFTTVGPAARARAHAAGVRAAPRRHHRNPVLMASFADVRRVHGPLRILLEHGAGQSYGGEPPPGTTPDLRPDCCPVDLFLMPGERVAARNRLHHPHATTIAVGCPKLDRLAGRARPAGRPVVAVTWHHPSGLCPESMWSWPEWAASVADLARWSGAPYELLGHGHPRAWKRLAPWWRTHGVPVSPHGNDVLARASVVCVDNSSIAYEATELGIPVVWLPSTAWRRDVEHGMRFWRDDPMGTTPAATTPDALDDAIHRALADDDNRGPARAAAVADVYARHGDATDAAVDAISAFLA